jgi:DHA1 family multidrug resistance protein-like MFS transporter
MPKAVPPADPPDTATPAAAPDADPPAAAVPAAAAPAAAEASDAELHPHWQRNRRALAAGVFCNTLGFTVCFPYLALIVQELGATGHLETWVGLLAGGFFTVSFLLAPVWGAFADHFGRRSMVLRAGLGMGLGFAALALSSSMGWFLPFFVLVGTCNGYVPAAIALVATNTPRQHLGRALAMVQTAALLGTTCGPAVGALLAGSLPAYRHLFWVSAAMSLVAGAFALAFVRERMQRPEGRFRLHVLRDSRVILRVPTMWVLFALSFLFSTTVFGSTTVIALYVLEIARDPATLRGLPLETWVGIATLALTISSAAAAPLWGRWLDRYETGRVLALSLLAGLLASAVFPFVQSPLQLTVARVVLGVCAVGIQPAVVQLMKRWSPLGMDARTLALGTSLAMLGNGAAPLAAGFIGPLLGLRAHFAFIALLLGAGLLLWTARGLPRVGRPLP